MTRQISIILRDKTENEFVFDVSIDDNKYKVAVTEKYWQSLTGGKITPEELVNKSFEFLLEREGPESILSEFDLPLIGHYFPEYEETMRSLV